MSECWQLLGFSLAIKGDRFRPAIDRHCDVGADHQATGW